MNRPLEESVAFAIARALSTAGSDTAFVVSGGASLHLINAFAELPGCDFVPVHHEQSAAMAADAFTRASGRSGVAIATSGPGATNLITGIAGCFYDSVPAIFLTGQVSTTRMVGQTGVRQIGFQETPFVDIVQHVAKLAVQIRRPEDARRLLEKCLHESRSGRPGPVVLDIPDDIQRALVVWDQLPAFQPDAARPVASMSLENLERHFAGRERPVIVAGAGVISADARIQFLELVEAWGVPVALTWGAADLMPASHPLRLGMFGTHGERHTNFAVQNADLVLSIGSRLDTKATGSPVASFARHATRIMVDVDVLEITKFQSFGLEIHGVFVMDAKDFLVAAKAVSGPTIESSWLSICSAWRESLTTFDFSHRVGPGLNPYIFMNALSVSGPTGTHFFLDTGCLLPWFLSSFTAERGQRVFHDFNNTAMGWSIPALLGGRVAAPDRPAVAIVGDGSFMMSMSDLRTLSARTDTSKIVVIDNDGHSMIRQTQDQWFEARYFASSSEGGLNFPDLAAIAQASGFRVITVDEDDFGPALNDFWCAHDPVLMHVKIDSSWRVTPQVRAGFPNEDMEPLLPRAMFSDLMIIPPLDTSK